MSRYGEDPFGDVENEISRTRGVLDGEAFRDREHVGEKPNGGGVGYDLTVNCSNCDKRYVVTVGWPELITAMAGALPVDTDSGRPWVFSNGFMYPPVQCGCGTMLSCPFTPDKAGRMVDVGVRMGKLNAVDVQNGVQHARRQLAGFRR